MDMDLQRFYGSLRLKLHFSQINQVTPSITQFPSAGITAASLGLRDKSTYQPPKGSHPLETFIHFVDKSFKNLRKDVDRGLIHYPSNLSVTERQALKSLQQEKDIIIKPADKGGAIVIMDKLHYRNEVYRQLGDSTTYRKLSHNPTTAIQDTVKTTLDGFQTRGILDDKTHAFLTKKHPITPVFYILPKIHKDLHNPPGRPIVASTDSVLAPISIYLEKILTPMIRNTRSFLLDTGAFLQIIEDITPVPSDAILVSFDVKDLYTSIPHTDGIHSTRWLLSNNNTNSGLIDLCCTLLSIVLNNNFFLFEDSYYLQTKGSAMGSNVAPPYANAYMAHYEDTLIYTNSLFRQHVLTWKRYIDDIFCIWKGDLDSLQIFFQFLKNAWPGLDFTMSHDPHQISFLDTLVNKDTDGNLSTDLYSKPTDRNSLLHYDSFHPPNMKKSIPKSQLNRVTKIVSDPVIKDQRISEMKSKFRERGYPLRILDNATTDHNIIKRPPASSRIPFIHQYHPAAYILHKTIRQHWHILQMAYPSVKEFQQPFLPCFKRPRNIKDSLIRADIGSIQPHTTQQKNIKADALSRSFLSDDLEEELQHIIEPSKMITVAPVRLSQLPPGKTLVTERHKKRVLHWGHSSKLAGHAGQKTLQLISRHYWWSTLRQDVLNFVAACSSCAHNKTPKKLPAGHLLPLPIPSAPWQHIAMDFITDLPASSGCTVIWVVVDRFSKMGHFTPLSGLPSAPKLAKLFIQHVLRLHGLPLHIVSDRGVQFISRFWRSLCKLLDVALEFSSAYHPQSNGQVERVNQVLTNYLRHFVNGHHSDWADLLPWAEFSYNNHVGESSSNSPFFIVYGQHPKIPTPLPPASSNPAAESLAKDFTKVWTETRTSLEQASVRTKEHADKRRLDPPPFHPGDKVWLSSRHIRLKVPSYKLAPRFIGPFEVLHRINDVCYRLKLPASLRIHNSFHVSLLKPVVLSRFTQDPGNFPSPVGSEDVYEVKDILAMKKRGGRSLFLVNWNGYGPEERSWEPVENINAPVLLRRFLTGLKKGGSPLLVNPILDFSALSGSHSRLSCLSSRNPPDPATSGNYLVGFHGASGIVPTSWPNSFRQETVAWKEKHKDEVNSSHLFFGTV
ncbi:unnamed protein product [Ranitomeya imitator]|uniref:Uncharacterized protein n=1 Tax=Ranitomeya imitator TaxID=111125 RepID=A0ABN9KSF8_9NEOB|nr:unnamed protein product [Ranitomeya imitator]